MNKHEEIKSAYQALGKEATFYDGMITCSTLLGKAVCRLVWDMGQTESGAYLSRALSGIPEAFTGLLLEVPVGTGVLTMPVYQRLPDASITCLDYSEDMMSRAQRRAKRDGLTHVRFQQGDVGSLPFPDGSFDIVLSLNGFHAFPDKEAAYREVFRVLKPGGCFCGCFYVSGETARTDWFIRHLYEPKGFFTPPYETADSLKQRLERQYEAVEFSTVKSIACFTCRKGVYNP
ncbi:MAG: class I SAM-dependent methyltransferase [Clostridiales bacterium]|nr:class I SAM-dependent methyltransferase [Clostridiales bacterium]